MAALSKTFASHLYMSKIPANIPVVCLTARFIVLGSQILKQLADIFTLCLQGSGKTCGLQVQEHHTKDKISCSKRSVRCLPACTTSNENFLSSYSACLSNPYWVWKMLLNPPHFSLFFFFFFPNSKSPFGSKMLQPMKYKLSFGAHLLAHTVPLKWGKLCTKSCAAYFSKFSFTWCFLIMTYGFCCL